MENLAIPQKSKFSSTFALLVIPICLAVAILIYVFIFGAPSNFQENGSAKPGNYLAIVHEGGAIVPVLMSFFLMVITFSVERFITIRQAYGSGSLDNFVRKIKSYLSSNDVNSAISVCEEQKGSLGNVTLAVLKKYKSVAADKTMSKDQKQVALQKELEEATSLELPILEKNLTILATLASVATLVGLLGTVMGMIKAFAALASSGTPNAEALATGISEALINTALGIASSAFAIIFYNLFTSQIDTLTYSIDEVGFSINQNFAANNKDKESAVLA
ncbi:MotA/TolQ/ExbB proton channel family protein [Cytophaga hutchinsonii]|jgi:biopolymer transport protein ExbB|uniref:Outer membrane transport energization protein ExbB n=1 Tax=Cytophaga hutchinsonii (strain ATCC 33406 / DSM 1761 / CIP 103989 / NBRC 15051 / NCIMB 9469 / D465) TaxID=269798 RepID=A0A6N4SS77_CYTH3|nr:MotA/TolQ/ExbB proton channel family protein [Cytophaga hutchinsonii]ABG59284.1 outer membrane transport energization protein ExbB [Cytophaga hutchinsonii ATCC 33406]SFX32627.1 outer membrane transport energization protein ExbB [Cytophaga hutchinsonii ATCC 33406]